MANNCESKPYSPLASATIVYHESIVSIGFQLAPTFLQDTRPTTPTPLSFNYILGHFLLLNGRDQIIRTIEVNRMSGSLNIDPKVEEIMMTEKSTKHEIEQADSDVTVTMPNHQPSTLLKKLASLPSPASLSELGRLCPTPPRTTLTVQVGPTLRPMSEAEKTSQTQTDVSIPLSAMMSTPSDRVETDNSPFTDTEQSRPTTGVTTASGQTEASSPATSTPGDEIALSWRQRTLSLGPSESESRSCFPPPLLTKKEDPLTSFPPCIQDIKDTGDEFTVVCFQKPFMNDRPTKDRQSASARFEKRPVSVLGKSFRNHWRSIQF